MTREGTKSELAVVSKSFSLTPKNLTEAMQYADLISKSEVCPKQYQGKPGDVLIAIQFGMEVGLSPLQALQNIACINGRPCMWGDAVLGLVRASGLLESFEEDDTEQIRKTRKGRCSVKRRGDKILTRTFSEEDAKAAGLWTKVGPWQQYPLRMLQMRARSWALRDAFADVLKGLSVREEVEDYETVATTAEGTEIQRPKRVEPPTTAPSTTTVEAQAAPEPAQTPDAPAAAQQPAPSDTGSNGTITQAEVHDLIGHAGECGVTEAKLRKHIKDEYGVTDLTKLTRPQFSAQIEWLNKVAKE